MRNEAIDLHKKVTSYHREVYTLVKALANTVDGSMDIDDLADTLYVLQQSLKFASDVQKELYKLNELTVKIECVLWVTQSDGNPIRTEFCTVSPKVSMIASVPNRRAQPEAFAELMKYLGIPEETWNAEGSDLVRVHWPGLVEHLSDRISQGLPVPPGIDPTKTYNRYAVVVRKRKDVEDAYKKDE